MSDRDTAGEGDDGRSPRDSGGAPEDPDGAATEDPFSELAEPESGDVPPEDVFTEVDIDVNAPDGDALWEELEAGRSGEAGAEPERDPAPDDASAGGEGAVVPKRSYCERCEHFTTPPRVACTHPGTEIRELTDMKHFRVVGCPVVARRREFEERALDGETREEQGQE